MTHTATFTPGRNRRRFIRALTGVAGLAGLALVVLFAWNSFAVPVLDADSLRFKEALGLTLLTAIAGRLLTAGRHHGRD